jgi:hypothetical protein
MAVTRLFEQDAVRVDAGDARAAGGHRSGMLAHAAAHIQDPLGRSRGQQADEFLAGHSL